MTIELKLLKNKRIHLAVTLLLCLGIILSGTFAWYSFSQNILNEFFGHMPRVNLHDDFKEPNKDVYVENTSSEPVIIRVKLLEFMMYNTSGNTYTSLPAGGKKNATNDISLPTDKSFTNTWYPHDCLSEVGGCDGIHDYWQWTMGGQKWYVPATEEQAMAREPTGNDKDERIIQNFEDYSQLCARLSAAGLTDVNGNITNLILQGYVTTLNTAIDDLNTKMNAPAPDNTAIADARAALNAAQKTLNDYLDLSTGGNTDDTKRVRLTRNATTTSIIKMENWNGTIGDFWVIDDDGWAYWASPLEHGAATGLLIDSVDPATGLLALKTEGKKYYYAIDITMQAASAEDVDKFDTLGGGASDEAEVLLAAVASSINSTLDLGAFSVGNVRQGTYWFFEGGVWKFFDGRWYYDGFIWSLDDEPYMFDPDGWFAFGDADYYFDDEWYFDGREWYWLGEVIEEVEHSGAYWYRENDVWKFNDGRWNFDGFDWTLEGRYYDFAPNGWSNTDGLLWYIDNEWYFNGSEWIYLGEDVVLTEPDVPSVPADELTEPEKSDETGDEDGQTDPDESGEQPPLIEPDTPAPPVDPPEGVTPEEQDNAIVPEGGNGESAPPDPAL